MRTQDIGTSLACPEVLLVDKERETLIGWTDTDAGWARVYTCQPPMIRLLRKHPHARLLVEYRTERGEITGVEYQLPITCLAIFARPRASTWERMLRSGPRKRTQAPSQQATTLRERSEASARSAQSNPSSGAPDSSS